MRLVSIIAVVLGWQSAMGQEALNEDINRRMDELERRIEAQHREIQELRRIVSSDRLMRVIEGHWDQTSHIRSGQKIPYTDDVIWQLKQSRAYQWVLSPEPPMWILGSMHIDATKNPAWITFRHDRFGNGEQVVPGIVKVDGNRVVLALHEGSTQEPHPADEYVDRPTAFESTRANGVSVFVLVRPDSN